MGRILAGGVSIYQIILLYLGVRHEEVGEVLLGSGVDTPGDGKGECTTNTGVTVDTQHCI